MVTVEEAKKLIIENAIKLEAETVNVSDALGAYLAVDVHSKINLPPFDQSAMDGYAVNCSDNCIGRVSLKVAGEVKAGDSNKSIVNNGEAFRIFTGAPVPEGAGAVVMQEKTSVEDDNVIISDDIKRGDNIRITGEQIKKGDIALPAGTKLTPAGIGFLSMLGVDIVEVIRKPKASILVTGSELAKPGNELKFGQVYECNSDSLNAALSATGFGSLGIESIKDDYELTRNTLDELINSNDVVIISGGISVGDYDFVGKALKELEVEQVYYKIRQKPGKPMFFGKKGNTLIFALPGNPSAALLCYYQYVLPALKKISGAEKDFQLKQVVLPVLNEYIKKGDRAHFLKAKITDDGAEILGSQSSAMLNTFAVADAFIYIPHDVAKISKGDKVAVHLFPI